MKLMKRLLCLIMGHEFDGLNNHTLTYTNHLGETKVINKSEFCSRCFKRKYNG